MFEALERALERDQNKFSMRQVEQIKVNNLADIKRIVADYDPVRSRPAEQSMVKARLDSPAGVVEVSAPTVSKSRRELLLEGLEMIRRRQEVAVASGEQVEINGVMVRPAALCRGDSLTTWVDQLIKRWFDGTRRGLHICWDLGGCEYRYDPFAHKLTKVEPAT